MPKLFWILVGWTLPFSAGALTALGDRDLATVVGRDGVTLMGDLNVRIGSFTLVDTDTNGGEVSFRNISIQGIYVETFDLISSAQAHDAIDSWLQNRGLSHAASRQMATSWLGDGVGPEAVIQMAFPHAALDDRTTPTVRVESIPIGNSGPSVGSLELRNLNLQGSKFLMWPR